MYPDTVQERSLSDARRFSLIFSTIALLCMVVIQICLLLKVDAVKGFADDLEWVTAMLWTTYALVLWVRFHSSGNLFYSVLVSGAAGSAIFAATIDKPGALQVLIWFSGLGILLIASFGLIDSLVKELKE